MAIAKNPFLGKLKGKVGNIILYTVDGEVRVRSQPFSYKDKRSPAQLGVRNRFKGALYLYKHLGSFFKNVWKIHSTTVQGNGYTLFMSHNIPAFGTDGEIEDFSKILLTTGTRQQVVGLKMTCPAPGEVELHWTDNSGMSTAKKNDRLRVACIRIDREHISRPASVARGGNLKIELIKGIKATRQDGVCRFTFCGQDAYPHIYCFFAAEDDEAFSPSQHFEVAQ